MKKQTIMLYFVLSMIVFSISLYSTFVNYPTTFQIKSDKTEKIDKSAGDNYSIWYRTWGGTEDDMGLDIAIDSNGNIYSIGSTESYGAGGRDLVLVKFYKNGTRAWTRVWGGALDDVGYGVALDTAGNIYCVGRTESFGAGWIDLALVKYYPNGNRAWNKTWGGLNDDIGFDIALDTMGNIYCIGSTENFGAGNDDFVLIKFYNNGTHAWTRVWGGAMDDVGYGVALDTAGNIYCVGYTESFGAGSLDLALVKYFSNGNRAWNRTWGGSMADVGYGVALDVSGNIFCIGVTNSYGAGFTDLALVKYYPNGNRAWNRTWGGPLDDVGYGAALDVSGNIYCCGFTQSYGAGGQDLIAVKYYPNGTRIWAKIWGSTNDDEGWGIAVDTTGNIYIGGYTYSYGAGNADLLMVKFEKLITSPPTTKIPGFELLLVIIGLTSTSIFYVSKKALKQIRKL